MKSLFLSIALLVAITAGAQQHTAMPQGMVYGTKPSTTGMVDATKVATYMGTKTRINTTLKGKVIKVNKTKGGWFDLDAGNGKIIAAHFKNYDVTIPTSLKGRTVIVEGVAAREFVADASQHFAGDQQKASKNNPAQSITFEVSGMMVSN